MDTFVLHSGCSAVHGFALRAQDSSLVSTKVLTRCACVRLRSGRTTTRLVKHQAGVPAARLVLAATLGSRLVLATAHATTANTTGGPTLVWFKHDLRLDDHPGLQEAVTAGTSLVPVFCFDPSQLGHLLRASRGLEGLLGAVKALKQGFQQLGSDLVILWGPPEEQLPMLVDQLQASSLILEEEVEYRWHKAVDKVRAALPDHVTVQPWKMHIFSQLPYPDNYKQFKQRRGSQLHPIEAPQHLPALPSGLDAGQVPLFSELKDAVAAASSGRQAAEVAALMQDLPVTQTWLSQISRQLVDGELAVQSALHQYLQCADSPSSAANQDLLTAVLSSEVPATPLGSFPAIFNQALALGTLSRRRVYHEAQLQQRKKKEGRKWQAGLQKKKKIALDVPHRSAANTAEVSDFHWHLASSDRVRDTKTGDAARHWRWRGFITDYHTAESVLQEYPTAGSPTEAMLAGDHRPGGNGSGSSSAPDAQPSSSAAEGQLPQSSAPAFLLVHGFGAFGEQWRGQIKALTAAGYQVYAPTFPGYGRSEKQALAYSQELWRDFLRDFVLEVVGRPVVIAGNSIGGFISASLAADYPSLVKGLVLLNSAGKVDKSYTPPTEDPSQPAKVPPKLLVDAASQGLFFFLRTSVARTLTRLYPVAPGNADEWLGQEILRAAADPGALGVFRSVFYLPKPRPLNYLIQELYGGPTLVLQGAKDPLSNAVARAKELEAACRNVRVQMLNAGHCPHDEVPHLVNDGLLNFMQTTVCKDETKSIDVPEHAASSA
ncbi:hypothetical protein ABBQ38_011843 [Trebouxia sp. C0009 RCD-2024]